MKRLTLLAVVLSLLAVGTVSLAAPAAPTSADCVCSTTDSGPGLEPTDLLR
ncbi:hypothetical protein [Deferrisoma sp.]